MLCLWNEVHYEKPSPILQYETPKSDGFLLQNYNLEDHFSLLNAFLEVQRLHLHIILSFPSPICKTMRILERASGMSMSHAWMSMSHHWYCNTHNGCPCRTLLILTGKLNTTTHHFTFIAHIYDFLQLLNLSYASYNYKDLLSTKKNTFIGPASEGRFFTDVHMLSF